jgi:GntR family transcriptional regulator
MPKLKYEQVADSLRARIADGEFGPGDTLPSGRDLCEQWSVSRATVIKAMDVLRGDGLIAARHGQGFRVTGTPLARPAGQRRAGTPRTAGGRPFRRLGTPTREVPPGHIVTALGLGPGDAALRRDRLVLTADGSPFSLITAWFPLDVAEAAPRLAQNSPIPEGTTHYVTRQTGRSPSRGRDVTTVRLATSHEAGQLQGEQPLTVIVVLHTAYDAQGRTLVVEEGLTPSRLWTLVDEYAMGNGS